MTSAHFSWSAPESRRLHEPRAPAWTELAADYIESFDTQGVSKEPDPGALKAKLHKELTADGLPPLQVIYACSSFVEGVSQRGFVQSMSRKGDCWDNAVAESFFHLLKTELTYHCRWLNYQAAYRSLFEYIEIFYNRERSHSTLYYVSPDQFEQHISTIAA